MTGGNKAHTPSKPTVRDNLPQKWKLDITQGRALRPQSAEKEPLGFTSSVQLVSHTVNTEGSSRDAQQTQSLLDKRAWDVAVAPFKALPMNLFVMYMSGNSISIFPIMMVAMMAWRPLKASMGVGATFKGLEEQLGSCLKHKAVFIMGNLAAVALALYKCSSMGLLPTHASDWLDFVQQPESLEFAGSAVAFS